MCSRCYNPCVPTPRVEADRRIPGHSSTCGPSTVSSKGDTLSSTWWKAVPSMWNCPPCSHSRTHTQFLKKLEFRLTPKAYTSKKSIVKSLSDGIPTYSLLRLEQYLTLILLTRASGLWTLKEKVEGSNSQYPDEKGNPSKVKSPVYRPPIYRRGRMEHQYLDPQVRRLPICYSTWNLSLCSHPRGDGLI